MAESQNDRHVVPNPGGGWDVTAPDGASPIHLGTQAAAIERALRIVGQTGGGGEVRIQGPYDRSNDQ